MLFRSLRIKKSKRSLYLLPFGFFHYDIKQLLQPDLRPAGNAEDWQREVGILRTVALVHVGEHAIRILDAGLCADAERHTVAPDLRCVVHLSVEHDALNKRVGGRQLVRIDHRRRLIQFICRNPRALRGESHLRDQDMPDAAVWSEHCRQYHMVCDDVRVGGIDKLGNVHESIY